MFKRILIKSEFSRNLLVLMTGATVAQAIPIAISPILTRVYSPEDFGVFALFVSISSVFSVIVTLRYELAIVQPENDCDAKALVTLSMIIATIISLLILVIVVLFNREFQELFDNQDLGGWLYLLPISVLITGIYQSLNYLSTRHGLFKRIAISKVNQGLATGGTQIVSSMSLGAGGLVCGYIVGQAISLLTLFKIYPFKKASVDKDSIQLMKANAKKYSNLPKYSTFGALADSLSLQMPIFILTKFYEMSVVGLFSFTFRVLNLPMSLLSRALNQVLFQKISDMQHTSPSDVFKLVLKIFFSLILIMLPIVILTWLFGEDLFSFVFGEPWRKAGDMASIIIVAVAIRFAVSPLSSVLALERNIKLGVFWQFMYLITVSTTLIYFSNSELKVLLTAFVIHEVVLYLVYFAFILKGSRVEKDG